MIGRSKPSWFRCSVLSTGLLFLLSCGGGTSQELETASDVEETSGGLHFTGRIDLPPLESITALQAELGRLKAVKEEGVPKGISGDLYALKGKHLGSFETGPEGEYHFDVPFEGLAFDEEVIVTTTSGVQKYQSVHHDAASGNTVNLGAADVITTLATEGMIQQLEGFTGWGNDYSEGFHGKLGCLYQIEEKLWTLADPNAATLSQEYGLLKQSVVALMAQKGDTTYGDWHLILDGVLTGKIDSQDALMMIDAGELDIKTQSTGNQTSEAGEVYDAVGDLLAALVQEDQNGSLCAGMEGGILDPGIFIAPILEVDNLEELSTIYSDDAAVKIHVGLMQDCLEEGCADIKDHVPAILDVMKAYEGDYAEVFDDDGNLDPGALKNIVEVAKGCGGLEAGKSDCIKEKLADFHEGEKPDEPKEESPTQAPVPPDPKITLCHIPPGNPANAHEIEVAVSSLPAHLEHGDYEGACKEPEPPPEPKVVICHIPPDNPANPQTIEVAVSSLPAHLEHGDDEGECLLAEISVLWNYTFGRIYGGFYRMIPGPGAAIGEVRPDLDGLEVATGNEEYYPFGYGAPSGRWFLFRPDGTVVFWKDTENDEAHSSVNLYDLDDDGRLELLGGTTSGNQVQAIDGEGNWFWRYYLSGHSISTPTVATLTPDGGPMVFNGCMDNQVRSIDGRTGTLNWAFDTGRWIWSTPAVADLDGDGHKEAVIPNDGQYYGASVLYSLDAETGDLNWQQNLDKKVHSSPAAADLDGDGLLEVLIGDGSGLFKAFNGKTGALKWSFATGGEILSSAAVGDLDGDGNLEAVFGSADGKVYALRGNGSLLWSRDVGGAVYSSPALARRNPGTVLHVYVTTMSGHLDILRGDDGSLVSRLVVGYEIASSPVVGDVDGDGKLEVFFQDRRADTLPVMAGDVFWAVRDEGSSVPPYAREWPLFRGDPAHTGVYPHFQ